MKISAVQKKLLLFILMLLMVNCRAVDVTQTPIQTAPVADPVTETGTSFPAAGTDCPDRYPSIPQEREYWPAEDWRESTLEEHCLDREKIEKAVWYFEQNYTTSGLVIIRHGELVYEKYFFSKPERHVQIYSITKSFLSALTGIALDQGKLDSLDHKVGEYFPEYFDADTDPRMKETSIRNLLTMSAGFVWLEDGSIEKQWMENENLVQAAINLKLQEAPGTGFNYSSAHTQILSAILTEVVGEPLRAYAQRNLFSPLGIRSGDWGWSMDGQGYYFGGWGINLSARDLARFGYLYLNDGYWDGEQIISKEWVRESTSVQIDTGYGLKYGYLWWVYPSKDRRVFEGVGYGGQSLYVVPDLDLVVVVTANVDGDNINGAPDPASIIRDWIVGAVTDQ